jgi:hypothetical protein
MVTWRIVDDDVECLHVERNPTMACSGSHLHKFYRYGNDIIPKFLFLLWAESSFPAAQKDQSMPLSPLLGRKVQ